jgi:hypothetical protein
MEGYGKYEYPNGNSYEGFCSKDKPHGKGTFRWANGKTDECEHIYGEEVKK